MRTKKDDLILEFLAVEAIPHGGGVADGITFFIDPQKRSQVIKRAKGKALAAIELMKSAPDNPYGNDDEKIAEAILQELKKRRANLNHE